MSARVDQRVIRGEDAVLLSKITVPALPRWMVARERITALVANGSGKPLTVVTGPPGAGKTVALASWAISKPGQGPIAWVTVDRFDNRPEIFWSYVVQALRGAGVTIPAELPALASRKPGFFLHRLATALADRDPPATLVVDDFHLLTEERSLAGLDYLIRNANAGMHLLVASRMDPLLPLHRYRLAGELTEIRAEDLAFSVSEAGLLMAQHGVTLPPESLKVLTRRDEGWVAGLRLAALSMQGHPDPEQFVKELDMEESAIAGYLLDEVLNAQPKHVRDLLLKTSILDRFNVELAGELAGDGGVVPALAQANAFIQPIGHGWYRYHSLFADVLRLKLQHESPQAIIPLRRQAALWLRRNGTLAEAVGQAIAAGDWPLAARIVVDELAVGTLLDPHADQLLADAFRRMPVGGPAPEEPPLAIVAAAMALRDTGDDGTWLAQAERLLDRVPADDEAPSRLAVALIRTVLARRDGDLAAATDAVAQAQSLTVRMPTDLLSRHPEIRIRELADRAEVELWEGRFDQAAATLDRCAAIAGGAGGWAGMRALVQLVQGRPAHAGRLLSADGPMTPEGRPDGALDGAADVALAWLHLERNDLRDAADRLSRAEHALRGQPDRLVAALAWQMAARLSLARGRAAAAAEMIGRARLGWSPPPWLEQRLALDETYARATAGDAHGALEAAAQAGPPSSLAGSVALARARLAFADPAAANLALASGFATAIGRVPDYLMLEALLLDAELCFGGHHADRGRQVLGRAIALAQKDGILLPFVIHRSWIEPVLRRDHGLAEAFRCLFQPGGESSGRSPDRQSGTDEALPVVVEKLSERELEVLRHVSKMMSTAEIAQEMYLSVNTVKSHLKSIFRKLGVRQRAQAVRRAQRLALL